MFIIWALLFGFFLLVLAVGFWLLITAIMQERWVRTFGLIISWFIILASIGLLIATVYLWIKCSLDPYSKGCPARQIVGIHGKARMQSPEGMPQPTQEDRLNKDVNNLQGDVKDIRDRLDSVERSVTVISTRQSMQPQNTNPQRINVRQETSQLRRSVTPQSSAPETKNGNGAG